MLAAAIVVGSFWLVARIVPADTLRVNYNCRYQARCPVCGDAFRYPGDPVVVRRDGEFVHEKCVSTQHGQSEMDKEED